VLRANGCAESLDRGWVGKFGRGAADGDGAEVDLGSPGRAEVAGPVSCRILRAHPDTTVDLDEPDAQLKALAALTAEVREHDAPLLGDLHREYHPLRLEGALSTAAERTADHVLSGVRRVGLARGKLALLVGLLQATIGMHAVFS